MGSISSLTSSSSLQSILQSALQKTASTSTTSQADQSSVSPLAQLLGQLQSLQQSNPAEYQQVTSQIATNLTSAAKADTASGNTAGAQQLTQLATDFTNASTSGQLPNLQDLAQAIGGGGGHHHHHHHADSSTSDSDSTTTTTASQALTAYQSGASQTSSTNALSIIQDALKSSKSSN
jgi:hypothetical protein